jgi:hypothetical protein
MRKEIYKKKKEYVVNVLKFNEKKNIFNFILLKKKVMIFLNLFDVKIDYLLFYYYFFLYLLHDYYYLKKIFYRKILMNCY